MSNTHREANVTSEENWPDSDDGISLTLAAPKKTDREEPAPNDTPPPASDPAPDRIYGVFSSEIKSKVGTGTTARTEVKQALWFANEMEPGEDGERVIQVQPLNNNNVPYGTKTEVILDEFLRDYSPELEYYQSTVYPKMRELDAVLTRAEKHRDQGALYSAQFGFEEALEFDEQNVRANFGLGLTYMAREDMDKAADIFKRVVGLDAAFSPEHKHLFNEFGISLRKSRLYDQAVEYYTRALDMTTDDENLYYNIARAHWDNGDRDNCRASLEKALEINPGFEAAQQFLDHLNKQGPTPDVSLD